jgi:hypothetical protein
MVELVLLVVGLVSVVLLALEKQKARRQAQKLWVYRVMVADLEKELAAARRWEKLRESGKKKAQE